MKVTSCYYYTFLAVLLLLSAGTVRASLRGRALQRDGGQANPIPEFPEEPEDPTPSEDEDAVDPIPEDPTPVSPDVPPPPATATEPFLMAIEDVHSVRGKGTIATGSIERGSVAVGDEVEVVGLVSTRSATVTGIEAFRKSLDSAEAGDNVGLVFTNLKESSLKAGMVVAQPDSIVATKSIRAEVYVMTQAEGGRRNIFVGYKPEAYVRTAGFASTITGMTELDGETEVTVAGGGETMLMDILLDESVAIEPGMEIRLLNGNGSSQVVAVATVTQLL